MKEEKKNIYIKIQNVKEKLLKENIKKSGKNKFAGYTYYELADFIPFIIKFCNEELLFTSISFDNEMAKLTIVNVENTEEKVEYTSPMRNLELKGCNEIQGLGGVETYSRRYLYMCAFDIIENDMFDAVISEKKENNKLEELKSKIKSYPNAIEVVGRYGKKLSDCAEDELREIVKILEGEKNE
jgi:hypothetical protein